MTPQQIAERVVNGALAVVSREHLQVLTQAVLNANEPREPIRVGPPYGRLDTMTPTELTSEQAAEVRERLGIKPRTYADGLRRAAEIVKEYADFVDIITAIEAEIARERA